MTAKTVTVVGIQNTKNDKYKRYYALGDIAEGKGFGQAAIQFTDVSQHSIGDEVQLVYTYKVDKNNQLFGVWEVLRL